MSMMKQLTLPITGMTCANCVATVERNLKKLDGVNTAVVNLSSERATVDFDSTKLALPDVIARVQRAGYGVATGDADLVIKRLSDDNDARRLEKALLKLESRDFHFDVRAVIGLFHSVQPNDHQHRSIRLEFGLSCRNHHHGALLDRLSLAVNYRRPHFQTI